MLYKMLYKLDMKVNISNFRRNLKKYIELDEDIEVMMYGKVVKILKNVVQEKGNVVQDTEESCTTRENSTSNNATLGTEELGYEPEFGKGSSPENAAKLEAIKKNLAFKAQLGFTEEVEFPGKIEIFNPELGEHVELTFEELRPMCNNYKHAVKEWKEHGGKE